MDYKSIDYTCLHIGDEVEGYEEKKQLPDGRICTTSTRAKCIITKIDSNQVELLSWNKYPHKVESNKTLFYVNYSTDELNIKYHNKLKQIYDAFNTEFYSLDDIFYDAYNAWIDNDIYSMAEYLTNQNIDLIGYHRLSSPKYSFLGLTLDVAIIFRCNEDSKDLCWCHTTSEYIDYMQNKYSFIKEW